MSPKLYCAIPNSYVVNGATELKGKYVKIISVNDWNGSIINVKVSNYGNGSYFYIILCLATNNIGRWVSGKLIAGNISGFSFYRVDKSIYMFIPDSIPDLYVTLDASMGNVSYGEEYENTIDLSNPITISWHNSLSTLDLGELLGNPKGTKSFSSWSEFTDFVNEMPIKTIQPFVSNFNAFAGEGFYGNVVQGLVIKQLEDAVFIFGIAIDGTLIFRKRNYPDVSTWEDPKIIIHSNNWHKIYFVTDLGGLIGINDSWFRSRIPTFKGDVETLVVSGIYGITPESINNPINGYGILSVFSVGNESRVMYLLISVNGATFIRVKYDKSDSKWKKLSLAS